MSSELDSETGTRFITEHCDDDDDDDDDDDVVRLLSSLPRLATHNTLYCHLHVVLL